MLTSYVGISAPNLHVIVDSVEYLVQIYKYPMILLREGAVNAIAISGSFNYWLPMLMCVDVVVESSSEAKTASCRPLSPLFPGTSRVSKRTRSVGSWTESAQAEGQQGWIAACSSYW